MSPERSPRIVRASTILATLLLCAMLTARGMTQLLASAVLPLAPEDAQPRAWLSAPVRLEGTSSPEQLARAVLERNIFDSQTGSMPWNEPAPVVETPVTEEEGEIVDPNGEPAFCAGSFKLVGTMIAPREPDRSFASIQAQGKTLLYRPGMRVEDHQLVGIREHRVFLRPSGRPLCQLAMFAPQDQAAPAPTASPAPPPPPSRPARPSNSGISEEDLNQGITKISDTSYSVSRGLLDRVLASQTEMMRAARIIPYEENGRVVGVKVYGIRRNALLGKLGIQNGDVLRTINGYDLSSPDTALEAYTKLRQADQFSISMIRRGQPQTMEYTVK